MVSKKLLKQFLKDLEAQKSQKKTMKKKSKTKKNKIRSISIKYKKTKKNKKCKKHKKSKSLFKCMKHKKNKLSLNIIFNKIKNSNVIINKYLQGNRFVLNKKLNKNILSTKSKRIINLKKQFDKIYKNKYKKEIDKNLYDYIQTSIKKDNHFPMANKKFYLFLNRIGKGAFGKVYLAIQKLTNRLVAIKIIKKNQNQLFNNKKKIVNEINIMNKLRKHKQFVELLEVFEDSQKVYIVMEYASKGDMLHYLKNSNIFSLQKIRKIFIQLLKCVYILHQKKIVHRDIKLDNIVINDYGDIKLCDFGISEEVNCLISNKCGTPAYLAPEVVLDQSHFGYKADVWSLGIVLYFLKYGKMPFESDCVKDVKKLILEKELKLKENDINDLIVKMLKKKPEE